MSDTGPELVQERHGAVSILRLNRPEARNALTGALAAELGEALAGAEGDPAIRAVVLTATGDRAFCSGMDLRSLADDADMALFGADGPADGYRRLLDGALSVPVVGAANGTALAGGLELLLGCDVVVASSSARFGFPEVKRGLFPGGGGTTLGTRIPLSAALEMLLTGDPVDAERAHALGLVNAVVAPGDVLAAAVELAERIAANGPLGLAAVKQLVRLWVTDPDTARQRLPEWQATVFGSDDAREGAVAFMEKRPPVWQGR
jgi:enoyl-CoA hydratase/carnithine racemase